MGAGLHVRGGRVGFLREGTHEVGDARQTRQLLPASCDAPDRLAAAIRSPGAESVREIELAENLEASDRVIALDTTMPIDPRSVDRLAATAGLTGVVSPTHPPGASPGIDRLTLRAHQVVLTRHLPPLFPPHPHLPPTLLPPP